MAPEQPVANSGGSEEADFAKVRRKTLCMKFDILTSKQTFQELAKGERTATALENSLSAVEAKIEELLAQAEKDQESAQKMKETGAAGSSVSNSNTKMDK